MKSSPAAPTRWIRGFTTNRGEDGFGDHPKRSKVQDEESKVECDSWRPQCEEHGEEDLDLTEDLVGEELPGPREK